ncbi:MAG TPA: DUF599 domain-containing protein [Paracoccaceae bacterium]|nr:DUF599 domain-containing protein [Paracoccaceae bacterium]
MDLSLPALALVDPASAAAAAVLVAIWWATGWIIEHPPTRRQSVARLMEGYRRAWMAEMVGRQQRIFDAAIVDSLRQGTAFFASACLIALGGGVALIGNADRLARVADDLSLAVDTGMPVEWRLVLVLLLLADALLRFLWSNRLFGYCAVLMGAVPNDPEDPAARPAAAMAAEINITAARSFNRGLRAIYFALAALTGLAGPVALAIATPAAAAILLRREFASDSRRAIVAGR